MTALVWLIELFTHYVIDHKLGNEWGPYSALQLVGFGFVVFALLVYDGSILRLPRLFTYPVEGKQNFEEEVSVVEEKTQTDL
jgi:hypothetical protein